MTAVLARWLGRPWLGWRGEIDDAAHGLYGRRLIPRAVLELVCDWYTLSIGETV